MKANRVDADINAVRFGSLVSGVTPSAEHSVELVAGRSTMASDGESEGLYKDLEQLLLVQIRDRPSDSSLQLRLLELYYEGRQANDFLKLATQFCDAYSVVENPDLWAEVARMGQELLPEVLFFRVASTQAEAAGAQAFTQAIGERLGDNKRYTSFFATLAAQYDALQKEQGFIAALDKALEKNLRRPTPLVHASAFSAHLGGAQIYLKREDESSTLTQLNIAVQGQVLFAQKLGRERLVSASRNGFSGIVVASIAKRMGMQALVFVCSDAAKFWPQNVRRLRQLGADVQIIDVDTLPSQDLRIVAVEYCLTDQEHAFLVMGLNGAPPPYSQLVIDSGAVIGREVMAQLKAANSQQPSAMVAAQEDSAAAIGFFAPYMRLETTRLACVVVTDVARESMDASQDAFFDDYQRHHQRVKDLGAHRAQEGLQYPSVRREQNWLKASCRVEYPQLQAEQVREVLVDFSRDESFTPALEAAHAIAYAAELAAQMLKDESVVVLLSDSGGKGIPQIRH